MDRVEHTQTAGYLELRKKIHTTPVIHDYNTENMRFGFMDRDRCSEFVPDTNDARLH